MMNSGGIVYSPRFREVTALQWCGYPSIKCMARDGYSAHEIVDWINANEGQARYLTECNAHHLTMCPHGGCPTCPAIELRMPGGSRYVKPGDYVQATDDFYELPHPTLTAQRFRKFIPINAASFEAHWEPKPSTAGECPVSLALLRLCGHEFVPHRDPQNMPVCQRCKHIYETRLK